MPTSARVETDFLIRRPYQVLIVLIDEISAKKGTAKQELSRDRLIAKHEVRHGPHDKCVAGQVARECETNRQGLVYAAEKGAGKGTRR